MESLTQRLDFITIKEFAQHVYLGGAFWMQLIDQDKIYPWQWEEAIRNTELVTTSPFILPELYHQLNIMHTGELVRVELDDPLAKNKLYWLNQHAFAERPSRFMNVLYDILAMAD